MAERLYHNILSEIVVCYIELVCLKLHVNVTIKAILYRKSLKFIMQED